VEEQEEGEEIIKEIIKERLEKQRRLDTQKDVKIQYI
jgi:hypothetical protein